MAPTLNIPSTVDDPSYRYKMPAMVSKIEGSGNGIKTCLVNMADVAKALKRPAVVCTKFFGCELGAVCRYDERDGEARSIVHGAHQTDVLQKHLDKFIHKYVLCPKCKYPEIDIKVKSGMVGARCAACGWAGDLDNAHPLAKVIVKDMSDDSGKKGKKSKAERQAERAEKARKKAADDDSFDDASSDTKTAKKDKKDKKEKKEKHDKADNKEKKDKVEKKEKHDKHHHHRKHEKKEKKSKKDKDGSDESGDADAGDVLVFDDEVMKSVVTKIAAFVDEAGDSLDVDDLFAEVRAIQVSQDFDNDLRLYAVIAALFPQGSLSKKSLPRMVDHIAKFIENAKMTPPQVFNAFEQYYAIYPESLKGYPMVLKVLHDEEVFDDEGCISYYSQDTGPTWFCNARPVVKPFVEWLQESEEESTSGEMDVEA